MSHAVLQELSQNKKRLDYFKQLKKKGGTAGTENPVEKWIQIYSERVEKLSAKADRLGLNDADFISEHEVQPSRNLQ